MHAERTQRTIAIWLTPWLLAWACSGAGEKDGEQTTSVATTPSGVPSTGGTTPPVEQAERPPSPPSASEASPATTSTQAPPLQNQPGAPQAGPADTPEQAPGDNSVPAQPASTEQPTSGDGVANPVRVDDGPLPGDTPEPVTPPSVTPPPGTPPGQGTPPADCGALINCAGVCVDPLSDALNCGACGLVCGVGQMCSAAVCVTGSVTPEPDPPEPDPPAVGDAPASIADDYPCDGDPAAYDVVVSNAGGSWAVEANGSSVYEGADLLAAVGAAFNSLDGGRTTQQSVLVLGDGSIDAQSRISIPSYTVFNVCGTIDVTGSPAGDNAPAYSRGTTDITIPNFSASGAPAYAMFFRDVNNLHLGRVELRLTSGLGIRVDNHGGDRAVRSTNLTIDDVYVEGASNHGVETYGVDGIQIGRVVARSVGYSGLLLNDSANAEVGLVDGEDVATGEGYAVFRMANRNGSIGGQYPTSIHVQRVIARGGGRGVFCVSESGGAVIDHVDLEGTGNNSILLENCFNVTVGNAAEQSRIVDSGELRIAARDDMPNTADITIQNIAVTGTSIQESPCADNSEWLDIETNGAFNICN